MKIVRFDQAFALLADKLAKEPEAVRNQAVIIRDLYGKLHIALPAAREKADELNRSIGSTWEDMGPYARYSGERVYSNDDFFDPGKMFADPDIIAYSVGAEGTRLKILDRQVTGQAWSRPSAERGTRCPRIAFYGLKGGVGRSTALAMAAYHLGRRGKKVLLVDLDLESPGLSGILLGPGRFPEYGIVDWFVEDAAGNESDLIGGMSATSELSSFPGVSGRIDIIPAFGSEMQEYVPKLSRVMIDVPKEDGLVEHFGDRARRLLETLEERYKPDCVLIDSRAGIHDFAAVSIVGLSDYAFCFGTNSPQTWEGYRLLFSYWRDRPDLLEGVRDKLAMVYALMPEGEQERALESFVENSYSLFSDMVYQELPADAADPFGVYNFDIGNVSAPHYPVCVKWNQSLLDFSSTKLEKGLVTEATLDICYGAFFSRIDEMSEVSHESSR